MEGLSIQVFEIIESTPQHQLKWRKCEVTNVYQVSIMNLKIEVSIQQTSPTNGDAIFEGWVRTPMTNWNY